MTSKTFDAAFEALSERIGGHVICIRRPPAGAHWEVDIASGILIVNLSEILGTSEIEIECHHTNDRESTSWSLGKDTDVVPTDEIARIVGLIDSWLRSHGAGSQPTQLMFYEALGWCHLTWGDPHVTIYDASGHRQCRWHTYTDNRRRVTLSLNQDVIYGSITLTGYLEGTREHNPERFVRGLASSETQVWAGVQTWTPPNGIRALEKWVTSLGAPPPRP